MKTRETLSTRKIALLATGDEIVNGDILNSNSQEISKRLVDLGMHVNIHAAAPDSIADIENVITFLLKSHHALIITGGLGPTSDDLTRFALSNALGKPLVFDEPIWENIVARLKQFGYSIPPESNRQQALFPETATIIPNPNGTAAGCMTQHHEQLIFMLPGPPTECLPMLETTVIPTLLKHQFQQISYHKSWMLFGVSEGQIAEELDEIALPFDCITGYRIVYPYIEFKIHSHAKEDFTQLKELIERKIKPYLISDGTKTASDMLKEKLVTLNYKIQIDDSATGGLLESILKTPLTHTHLTFINEKFFTTDNPGFTLSGLTEYWQQQTDCKETPISLGFFYQNHKQIIRIPAPLRGDRVKHYAVEWACYQMSKLLP